jgi:hypothetical protein
MVSVLAIGSKVRAFKPRRGEGFLKAIKSAACSPSGGGGRIKPSAPCGKILRHVENKFKV